MSNEFHIGDLREIDFVNEVITNGIDELYQLAADMGGAGYILIGENDADIMRNSVQINVNVAKLTVEKKVGALFYASSACIYPEYNQLDPQNPKCSEDSAYPAAPDSEYGWEKLFSERLYLSYKRNYGLNVKIARFNNIFGEMGVWNNGKEKAPAALCRKIAMAKKVDTIDIWGNGNQTRSFLYIEDCLDAVIQLTRSEFTGPYNIGSEEMISINEYALLIAEIAKKKITFNHISGPQGVRGRSSNNDLICKDLKWTPKYDLKAGTTILNQWIENQVYED